MTGCSGVLVSSRLSTSQDFSTASRESQRLIKGLELDEEPVQLLVKEGMESTKGGWIRQTML